MQKKEYLNKSCIYPEDKIDDIIYSKYNLKHYGYISPYDIHKKLNLKDDDENMCTRLVKLTNYNLDNLEPYKSKKNKMDTYIIVKEYLDMINEQNKKENLKKKSEWIIRKPETPKPTFLSEKNEIINDRNNKKEFDSYYDFIDVNDITKYEDINRLTELTIASYDYYKKSNDVYKKKLAVKHNIPNLRLYNKHYGQLVNFKKMENKEEDSIKENDDK
eukprot:jgi/Orpsp1_1/1175270/evm.model.c7180000053241.1